MYPKRLVSYDVMASFVLMVYYVLPCPLFRQHGRRDPADSNDAPAGFRRSDAVLLVRSPLE